MDPFGGPRRSLVEGPSKRPHRGDFSGFGRLRQIQALGSVAEKLPKRPLFSFTKNNKKTCFSEK